MKVPFIIEYFIWMSGNLWLAYLFQYLPYITWLTPLQPIMSHLLWIFGIYLSWVDWFTKLWMCYWIVIVNIIIHFSKHWEILSRVNLKLFKIIYMLIISLMHSWVISATFMCEFYFWINGDFLCMSFDLKKFV